MPVDILPPGAFLAGPTQKDAQAEARALWSRWNSGVSVSTAAARRSDLASFGAHAWRSRDEFAVIRRVIATLASDRAELRTLAIAWRDAEIDRGASVRTMARRWSTLASLVAAIAKHRRESFELGGEPRDIVGEIDASQLAAIVSTASERSQWSDAAIVGMIGSLGLSDDEVARMRCHELRAHAAGCSALVFRAAERVCEGRPARTFAFDGRRCGTSLSPRGVRLACERWGTTAAALRRLAARASM